MSSVSWRGDAPRVAQVNTITPANVASTNTFTVTIGGKAVTFTSSSNTAAHVTAGLYALINALDDDEYPEFAEVTWLDNTGTLTATAATAGLAFTQTSSASGGTATLVTSTTTANSSPNDWSVAGNWSGGAVPVNSDDVTIDGDNDITDGLGQSAVTLTSLTIPSTFTGVIGRPVENETGYIEYRKTYLEISASTVTIGRGTGNGSSRIKLNVGSVQTAVTVHKTARSAETGLGAFIFKGTNASNVLTAISGSVWVAPFGGETAVIATLRADDATVFCGSGVTLTTVTHSGTGSLTICSAATTINQNVGAGLLYILGSGAYTTLNCYSSNQTSYQSSGTVTTLNLGADAKIEFETNASARTVTNTNLYSGSQILDRSKTVTFTNPIATPGCSIADIDAQFGVGRTYAVA